MMDVERHLPQTHFCWIGGNGPSDPFYYRIQSPVIFIEFDHHPGLFLTNPEPLGFPRAYGGPQPKRQRLRI